MSPKKKTYGSDSTTTVESSGHTVTDQPTMIQRERSKLAQEIRSKKEREQEQRLGLELATRVSAKLDQIKKLAEDLKIEFDNSAQSNDYQSYYVEQVDRVADDLLGSLRAASLSIN